MLAAPGEQVSDHSNAHDLQSNEPLELLGSLPTNEAGSDPNDEKEQGKQKTRHPPWKQLAQYGADFASVEEIHRWWGLWRGGKRSQALHCLTIQLPSQGET